jgi:hypothetical protein
MACGIVAACGGDDPTEPTGVSGSMAFSYQGAGSTNATTFNASGAIPLSVGGETNSNNLGTSAWAAGAFSTTQNYAVVGGVIPKTSNTWDVAQVIVNRSTVGTNQISVDCSDPEVTTCTGVFLMTGLNPNGDSLASICYLTTGSVTISAISTANITGTFSGTGTCYNGLTAAESPFTVTNGTFNVGVTSQLLL